MNRWMPPVSTRGIRKCCAYMDKSRSLPRAGLKISACVIMSGFDHRIDRDIPPRLCPFARSLRGSPEADHRGAHRIFTHPYQNVRENPRDLRTGVHGTEECLREREKRASSVPDNRRDDQGSSAPWPIGQRRWWAIGRGYGALTPAASIAPRHATATEPSGSRAQAYTPDARMRSAT